jgi:signal transduction histidine kinase
MTALPIEQSAAAPGSRTLLESAPADPCLREQELQVVDDSLRSASHQIQQTEQRLEQRVLERTAELAQANRDLAHRQQENELFVYSVSHDLRSPLVNLKGFSQELAEVCAEVRALLADESVPQSLRERGLTLVDNEMSESIGFIQTAVTRLSRIIDALLQLSRVGRVEYQWQTVDVAPLVQAIIASMAVTIDEKGAHVSVDPLPAVWGDPLAIEQVFANLISNALNYLDPARPGCVVIGCSDEATVTGPGQALYTFYVRDNGLGIPEAHRPRLFQAFQRLHPQMAEGEGMGLMTVRRIVERHAGKIWVESTAGVGSTFFVTLPARAPAGRAAAPANTTIKVADGEVTCETSP